MSKIRFRPVQGLEEKIKAYPQTDGYFYVATDTGRVYLDTATENKIPIGSSGVQVIYGTEKEVEIDYDADENPIGYSIRLSNLSSSNPHVNDLILNSDGAFYRIKGFKLNDDKEEVASCEKLLAGGGSQDQEVKVNGTVSLTLDGPTDVLNGESVSVTALVKCRTINGEPVLDSVEGTLTIRQKKSDGSWEDIYSEAKTYQHNKPITTDISAYLRNSSTHEIEFIVSKNSDPTNNHFSTTKKTQFVTTHELTLQWQESEFSNNSPYDGNQINVVWLMTDKVNSAIEIYFDNYLVLDRYYNDTNNNNTDSFIITKNTIILDNSNNSVITLANYFLHGEHTIKAKLYLVNGNEKGNGTDFIEKEIVILDKNSRTPLIWTGSFKEEYYTYETIRIPFRVYDPNTSIAIVNLYKNGVLIGTREVSNQNEWQYWEITNLSVNDSSYYTIKVGTEPYDYSRNFTFIVKIDPLRNMELVRSGDLRVNFVATGRSNSESKLSRETLKIRDKYAEFKNFNWYNNGWVFDENNTTCLRVSNGAEVSIPIGQLSFDDGTSKPTHSIEIQFKIRNPQNYSKVITKYTRYKSIDGSWNDEDSGAWAEFQKQTEYVNYDEFLTKKYLREHPEAPSYDNLTYGGLSQVFNLNNLVCAYGSLTEPLGIYFSPQDATFTADGGEETVSVDFVEDEMLYLSFVYTKEKSGIEGGDSKLLEIFLNGVLTSVARRKETDSWTINSDVIKFMSNACDIDIYSIRVYDATLTIPDIVQNYAFDKKSINQWDQKNMYQYEDTLNDYLFSYRKMLDYNSEHSDKPLMPYIILKTTQNNNQSTQNRLPYSKDADPQKGTLEFVNVPLDNAYARGELDEVAEKEGWSPIMEKDSDGKEKVKYTAVQNYYLHHCPSFTTLFNGATFQVQGTSSRNYPRRNYKAKCKNVMFMNKGPFESIYKEDETAGKLDKKSKCFLEYFYMDNETVGTNKFTLKIDFMESSGDYNRGFANFVNETYSHHPLKDYNDSNTFQVFSEPEEAKEYVEGKLYKYYNHKENLKITDGKNDNLVIKNKEDFDMGPYALYQKLMEENPTLYTKLKVADSKSSYYNKWYENKEAGYVNYNITNLKDYRTSVKGYPVLAFHWQSTDSNEYNDSGIFYIGKYNMLLDKGSDECFGFKPKGSALQSQINGKPPVENIAECWEFQNNSRTYCSFRDPWNRYKLSFRPPVMEDNSKEYLTSGKAPIVADSFEVRYNANDDLISKGLFNCEELSQGSYSDDLVKWIDGISNVAPSRIKVQKVTEDITGQESTELTITNPGQEPIKFDKSMKSSRELLLALMSNWEDAVSWVWSTCLDCTIDFDGISYEIPSMGQYEVAEDLAEAKYELSKYYVFDKIDEQGNDIYKISEDKFDKEQKYYTYDVNNKIYNVITLTDNDDKVYQINKYYTLENNIYILNSEKFNPYIIYYSFTENENDINDRWLLPSPITYGGITYTKDSKEYRQAKFKNELSNYFNIEYLATYFLMTEIFECYDSRGKNAMFASWGPQKGNIEKTTGTQHYIWYPIFYDIDTQLGINNTGIPSFEYYVDATEEGSFSTNDSVLWNNFYSFFRTKIIDKYKQLMGQTNGSYKPSDVKQIFVRGTDTSSKKSDIVDKWYKTDPSLFPGSYAVQGERPIIALSLDEEYKYIIPTNSKAENTKFGRITETGLYSVESDQYFYALQGDRNLYRSQFLANRLNYIDSWLTLDEYSANGGSSKVRSRISANNPDTTSDKWIEGAESSGFTTSEYWKDGKEFGTKNHLFDGEYWIKMEPARRSYVTVGTDTSNFPSLKYNGLTPVRFEATDLKKGVKSSPRYREQLYYIYGLEQMKSLGDLSKLYFQEFSLSGKASKLVDLLLGYDGISEEGPDYPYRNVKVNNWSFPSGGMPLLKEMNLCGIQFTKPMSLDLSKSEKLENFRDTDSNITKVQFAEGVALNTLYLTDSTNYLSLIEANLLTKLITSYVRPTLNDLTNRLEVAKENKGLYIKGLTDASNDNFIKTNIKTLDIRGGNLDYYSYELLRRYYIGCENSELTNCSVNLTNVQWSPYRLLNDDKVELDSINTEYYKDNGHFQLEKINAEDVSKITSSEIKNNLIYYYDNNVNGYNDIHSKVTDYTLLCNLYNKAPVYFKGINQAYPNITGIIYIENTQEIEEHVIQEELQSIYPNLTIFVKNVKKEYSAKFVLEQEDANGVLIQEILKTQKLPLSSSKFFDNPTDSSSETYISFGSLQEKMPTYNFKGWEDDTGELVITVGKDVNEKDVVLKDNWGSLSLQSNKIDYIFKARFERKSYTITFVNGDRVVNDSTVKKIFNYGERITVPEEFYYFNNTEVTDLPNGEDSLEWTWRQTGWADKEGVKIDLTRQLAYADREFYAVGEPISVYDNILVNDSTHKYYDIINSDGELSFVMTDLAKNLKGKITLPTIYNGQPITRIRYSQVNPSAAVGIQVNPNITAVFFAPKDSNKISVIDDYAFTLDSGLEYFQFSDCLKKIGIKAFYQCPLSRNNIIPYSSSTEGLTFGAQAFYQSKMGSYSPYNLIIEGCKDGILNFDVNAFSGQTILNMSGNQFKGYTGAIQVQIGTNKHPIKQITTDSSGNIFTPRQTGMPTVANGYTGRFRYYYVASYGESVKNTLHRIYEAMISNRANFEEEPIVK